MKEEIEELIKSGFSLELISFELDIPIEQLKRYKINLENNRLARKNNIDKGNGKNQSYSKISEMREKYKELYFKSNKDEIDRPEPLLQQDMKLIRTVIASVQEKIEQMKTMTKEEKKKIANSILKELKKIEGYQLPIVEAEKLYDLMCSNELQNLNLNKVDRILLIDKSMKVQFNLQMLLNMSIMILMI